MATPLALFTIDAYIACTALGCIALLGIAWRHHLARRTVDAQAAGRTVREAA